MIIVSQDKTKIVNFDNLTQIYITQDEEETAFFIRYEAVDSLYDDLGEYKTEERAKEVLQEIISYNSRFNLYKCSSWQQQEYIEEHFEDNVIFDVYKMPKE